LIHHRTSSEKAALQKAKKERLKYRSHGAGFVKKTANEWELDSEYEKRCVASELELPAHICVE